MEMQGTPVLAFGTSGDQGTGLVEAIHARGAIPVLATSRDAQVQQWQAEGLNGVVADLTDPDSLPAVADAVGARAAVLHMPLSLSMAGMGEAVAKSVATLTGHGLAVAVNVGTPIPPPGAPDPFNAMGTAAALTSSGATVLGVTAYLENLSAPWSLGLLAAGELVYPRPASDPLRLMTARDVTTGAVAAIARDLGGRVIGLAGPQLLTFEQLAAELSAGLERPVTFRRVTAEAYADLLRPVVGEAAAQGVAGAYGSMPEEPNPLMGIDAAAGWAELGVTPMTAREWAARHLEPLLG